jgi:hypothetical protein
MKGLMLTMLLVGCVGCGAASLTAPTTTERGVTASPSICAVPIVLMDDVNMAGPSLLLSVAASRPYQIELTRLDNSGLIVPFAIVDEQTSSASIDVNFDTTYQYRVRYLDMDCWSDWAERYVRPRNGQGSEDPIDSPAPQPCVSVKFHPCVP